MAMVIATNLASRAIWVDCHLDRFILVDKYTSMDTLPVSKQRRSADRDCRSVPHRALHLQIFAGALLSTV